MPDQKPRRAYTSLNHFEPTHVGNDDSGKPVYVQHYSVHEVIKDESAPNGVRYVKVADDLTSAEADQWVRGEKGQDA